MSGVAWLQNGCHCQHGVGGLVSPRMVRLVLFDIDGTLIRTGGAGVKAFAKTFETEFKIWDGFEQLQFAGGTDGGIVRRFFNLHQVEPTPENFTRLYHEIAGTRPALNRVDIGADLRC